MDLFRTKKTFIGLVLKTPNTNLLRFYFYVNRDCKTRLIQTLKCM